MLFKCGKMKLSRLLDYGKIKRRRRKRKKERLDSWRLDVFS